MPTSKEPTVTRSNGWARATSNSDEWKEPAMKLSRITWLGLGFGAALLLATQTIDSRARAQGAPSNARGKTAPNPITGEGLPNPAPMVTRNWGQLPSGRKWGTTAGTDIH